MGACSPNGCVGHNFRHAQWTSWLCGEHGERTSRNNMERGGTCEKLNDTNQWLIVMYRKESSHTV